jgi:hypothetical protein
MGHSLTIAVVPRQRSHPQVGVPRDSWPHFNVSDCRLPISGGPGSRIYMPQEQGGPVIPPGAGFSFRRPLRLAELRRRYSIPPQNGSWRFRWTHDFYSVILLTQNLTHCQKCFRKNIAAFLIPLLFRKRKYLNQSFLVICEHDMLWCSCVCVYWMDGLWLPFIFPRRTTASRKLVYRSIKDSLWDVNVECEFQFHECAHIASRSVLDTRRRTSTMVYRQTRWKAW